MSDTNSVKASARLLRVSPRKLNLVASFLRGLNASEALLKLSFSNKHIAKDVKRCLHSAIANAENNFGLNIDDLFISSATVGKALVMKRRRVRARGRSFRINKFFSNLYITLKEGGR
ncbi:MAG: 50S ribosomal protein L22 [Rickettsiaceae bacterium]